MEENVRLEDWKRKKAKLEIVQDMMAWLGYKYQKLGGEIFSDFLFAQEDPNIKDMLQFLDHLSKNNVKQDVSKDVTLLIAHADFLKELEEVRKDLIQIIKELQPETHKESPIPTVNS